jgi:hypothetical protein
VATGSLTPSPIQGIGEERAPFLAYVQNALESALAVCVLNRNGRRVTVDSFRLMGLRRGKAHTLRAPRRDGAGSFATVISAHFEALTEIAVPRMRVGGSLSSGRYEGSIDDGELKGSWEREPPAPDEYVFSFPLPPVTPVTSAADYLALFFVGLLNVIELLEGGVPVVPDTVYVGDAVAQLRRQCIENEKQVGPREQRELADRNLQPLHAVISSEPAVLALAHHWAILNRIVVFSAVQGTSEIVGISLRRNSDWVVDVSGDPMEIYQYLGRVCNVSCKFCYLFGNPTEMGIARGHKTISLREMETRLKYYDPKNRKALFRAQWEVNEILVDPQLSPVLARASAENHERFCIHYKRESAY